MATKTRNKSESGRASIMLTSRLAFALRHLPINRQAKIGTLEVLLSRATKSLRELVELAGELSVDPRWLAIGRPSKAGHAAALNVRRWRGNYELPEAKVKALVEFLHTTPEPDRMPGTCRYCDCTEECACAEGCAWVDRSATICSACLIKEEA